MIMTMEKYTKMKAELQVQKKMEMEIQENAKMLKKVMNEGYTVVGILAKVKAEFQMKMMQIVVEMPADLIHWIKFDLKMF